MGALKPVNLSNFRSQSGPILPSSFQEARKVLDDYLALTDLAPWDYRKGVGYLLRGQSDYADVFQLKKFAQGRHKDWKPFMAHLLGFDPRPVEDKYDTED